ncbi:hypothetical protein PIB30_069332 [Stylosanthes scabra]|uniref:non-specific serine/threonine protein kinase n=1 Tax=Stylosanthes scabra TaxID=79078 RepID=A0ABU6SP35_9FABA|nr:hypothetical protein [Stylosanthes scabra]
MFFLRRNPPPPSPRHPPTRSRRTAASEPVHISSHQRCRHRRSIASKSLVAVLKVEEVSAAVVSAPRPSHPHLIPSSSTLQERRRTVVASEVSAFSAALSALKIDFTNLASFKHAEFSVGKALKWSNRLAILIGVAKAVHFLHTGVIPGCFENQLKTRNIFLDEHRIPKLSDYGIAIIREEIDKHEVPLL